MGDRNPKNKQKMKKQHEKEAAHKHEQKRGNVQQFQRPQPPGSPPQQANEKEQQFPDHKKAG